MIEYQMNYKYGIWIDGIFSWLGETGWVCESRINDTGNNFFNNALNLKVNISKNEDNGIELQKVTIYSFIPKNREIKLFILHDLDLDHGLESISFYAPTIQAIIRSYKDHYLLLNGELNNQGIVQYCTDYEECNYLLNDGLLSIQPFSINSEVSIFSLEAKLKGNEVVDAFLWMCKGEDEDEVLSKNLLAKQFLLSSLPKVSTI